jgi:hypothetical protein
MIGQIPERILTMDASRYTLKLHKDFPGKGWLLELHMNDSDEEDVAFVETFRATAFRYLGAAPHGFTRHDDGKRFVDTCWFLQGESSDWLMFEFWTSDQSAILDGVIRVIDALNMQGIPVVLQ